MKLRDDDLGSRVSIKDHEKGIVRHHSPSVGPRDQYCKILGLHVRGE